MTKIKEQTKARIVTTIEVTEIPDGAEERYIERFLSPHTLMLNRKVYIYPEVHAALSRMVKGLDRHGVSIASYASEIILEHIARNNAVMRSVHERNRKDLF